MGFFEPLHSVSLCRIFPVFLLCHPTNETEMILSMYGRNVNNGPELFPMSSIRTSLIHRTIQIRVSVQHPDLMDHQALGLWYFLGFFSYQRSFHLISFVFRLQERESDY